MPKNSSSNPEKQLPLTSLPVLNQVSIKEPCLMSWSEMDGDAAKRFCGHCQKHVHNFSEMNSDSVAQLMGSGESVCAKIQRRPDGSIITKQPISRRGWFGRLGTVAASAFAVLVLGGCKDDVPEVMGDVGPAPSGQIRATMGEAVAVEEMGDVVAAEMEPPASVETQKRELMGKATMQPKPESPVIPPAQ